MFAGSARILHKGVTGDFHRMARLEQFDRCVAQIGGRIGNALLSIACCTATPAAHQSARYQKWLVVAGTAPGNVWRGRAAFIGAGDAVWQNFREGAKDGVVHAKTDHAARAAGRRLIGVDDRALGRSHRDGAHVTFATGNGRAERAAHRQITHGVGGRHGAIDGRLNLF